MDRCWGSSVLVMASPPGFGGTVIIILVLLYSLSSVPDVPVKGVWDLQQITQILVTFEQVGRASDMWLVEQS